MQISLFEDRKEIQLRFKEADPHNGVLSASQGNDILSFHTHVKFILPIPRSISKILVSMESENIVVKHPWFSNLYKVPCATVQSPLAPAKLLIH